MRALKKFILVATRRGIHRDDASAEAKYHARRALARWPGLRRLDPEQHQALGGSFELKAGLREQDAVDATLVLTTYVVGFALEKASAGQVGEPTRPRRSSAPSIEQYPTLMSLAPLVQAPAPSSRFRPGLAVVLDGIQARAEASRGGRKTAGRDSKSARPG
jgi:hypothetical protein